MIYTIILWTFSIFSGFTQDSNILHEIIINKNSWLYEDLPCEKFSFSVFSFSSSCRHFLLERESKLMHLNHPSVTKVYSDDSPNLQTGFVGKYFQSFDSEIKTFLCCHSLIGLYLSSPQLSPKNKLSGISLSPHYKWWVIFQFSSQKSLSKSSCQRKEM